MSGCEVWDVAMIPCINLLCNRDTNQNRFILSTPTAGKRKLRPANQRQPIRRLPCSLRRTRLGQQVTDVVVFGAVLRRHLQLHGDVGFNLPPFALPLRLCFSAIALSSSDADRSAQEWGGLIPGPIWPCLARFTPNREAENEAGVASFGAPPTRKRVAAVDSCGFIWIFGGLVRSG